MENHFQTLITHTGGVLSVLLILSIPFSTSIAIIITGLLLLSWLLSWQFVSLTEPLKHNSIVFFSLLLAGYLLIGVTYSSASFEESINIWFKYREFLLVIILIPFLSNNRYRQWGLTAFIIGSIITLAVSYAIDFNFIKRTTYSASAKSSITHSIFVAYFAYFCAQQAYREPPYKLFWVLLLLASIHNLYFVTFGRTGQLIAFLLALLFSFQHFNKQKILLFILASIVSVVLFVNYTDSGHRIVEGITNTKNYDAKNPETTSSMGRRLTYWKHALSLIKERPWFGHGTGSFAKEYTRISSANEHQTTNPHSTYLLIATQVGIGGLLLYLGFLFSLYWRLQILPDHQKCLAQGVLLTIVTSSIFNSPILDHTEGHWFACLVALFFTLPKKRKFRISISMVQFFNKLPTPTGVNNENAQE
jgi:O-antigen ligase